MENSSLRQYMAIATLMLILAVVLVLFKSNTSFSVWGFKIYNVFISFAGIIYLYCICTDLLSFYKVQKENKDNKKKLKEAEAKLKNQEEEYSDKKTAALHKLREHEERMAIIK